jgi:hypothetical protein
LSEASKKSPLRWLWSLVPLVAVIEVGLQWYIPRQDPSADDWQRARDAIAAEKTDRDLVLIAPDWAVHGRVHLGELIDRRDLGRFDATRYDRLFEVSLRGARTPEAEGLEPESETDFGKLVLRRYALPRRDEILYDLLDELPRCRTEGAKRLWPWMLVDHWFGTRLTIQVPLRRKPVALTCPDVPLGATLRGYGMVARLDYRAHRLPSGPPVEIAVAVEGEPVDTVKVGNFSPLEPFEVELPGSGRGNLRLEISSRGSHKRAFGFVADVRRPLAEGER